MSTDLWYPRHGDSHCSWCGRFQWEAVEPSANLRCMFNWTLESWPKMRPQSRNGFGTAIICALALEFDAVEALPDEHYDEVGPAYGKQHGDPNWYRTGRAGQYNVVLTCLPGTGKGNAASVVANLQISFPRVDLAFLVGICGGVPFPSERTEIILGDVIVRDRVIEYDFGWQYPDSF
jgi:hypothetical protein